MMTYLLGAKNRWESLPGGIRRHITRKRMTRQQPNPMLNGNTVSKINSKIIKTYSFLVVAKRSKANGSVENMGENNKLVDTHKDGIVEERDEAAGLPSSIGRKRKMSEEKEDPCTTKRSKVSV